MGQRSVEAGANAAQILVVDDHQLVRSAVTRAFNQHGYACESVECAQDAIRLMERQDPYSLVLVDIVLPSLAGEKATQPLGIEVALAARARHPQTRVVLMTGHWEEAVLAAKEGFMTLTKPVEGGVAELLALVRNASGDVASEWVGKLPVRQAQRELRTAMVDEAMARTNGNISAAAQLLGISRQALQQELKSRQSEN